MEQSAVSTRAKEKVSQIKTNQKLGFEEKRVRFRELFEGKTNVMSTSAEREQVPQQQAQKTQTRNTGARKQAQSAKLLRKDDTSNHRKSST